MLDEIQNLEYTRMYVITMHVKKRIKRIKKSAHAVLVLIAYAQKSRLR